MKNRFMRVTALGLAMATAFTFTAPNSALLGAEAAAKKQATAATEIKIAKTASVKVGKTAKVKVKINKKATKKVTVTVKSSNAKVAKVAQTLTIKKGKKAANLKVTGKKAGKANVTLSFKNSKGKTIKKTIKVTVKKAAAKKVAVTGVTLSNSTPKVGETLTANVAPSNATNVTYAWYTGDSATALNTQVAGAATKELKLTEDMLGKFVGVVVNGDSNSTANAVTAVAVAEADAADIRIVEAKQSGAKTVDLTITGKITANDKITVKKGSNEVKIDDTSYTETGATITLADRITASEYEITLTPADTKIKASSVKFTGEVSELKEIKFLNNYLVMKDSAYSEGYAYAKGIDQFGGEVNLSGLTVTPGVGKYKSYDTETGKITIESGAQTGQTSPFMTIKEVPVFIQYQQGTQMISAQQTLTVSTMAYVTDLEFGDIDKSGTKREDNKLTITELKSKKYYVEIKSAKDQYGNTLSADDLQNQKDEKTLFVIPDDSGAFFKTGKFDKVGSKTVLWLEDVGTNTKPGTMTLTITGAGGKSFTKDITIEDDPYIQTLTVSYPELYSGDKETAALEFSAKDQYGMDVDLWDFKPKATGTSNGTSNTGGQYLIFDDENHLTNMQTTIQASGSNATFNAVTYDSSKKTFKVTLKVNGAKSSIASFVATTAGMQVNNSSITIGGQGIVAKVKGSLASGADTQITRGDGANQTFNFNKYVRFEDANGNTMKRSADTEYPEFYGNNIAGNNLFADDSAVTYNSYAWTVSTDKPSADKDLNTVDTNGTITYGEMGSDATKTFYVTVYGVSGANYYILDSKSFRLTKVVSDPKSYKATVTGTLYADEDSTDSIDVKVNATTTTNETYEVDSTYITLASGLFASTYNTLYGANKNISAKGTETVTVYVDGDEAASVDVPYDIVDPSAKKAVMTYYADTTYGKVGDAYDDDETEESFEAVAGSSVYIGGSASVGGENKDLTGKIAITTVNDLHDDVIAYIEDQYEDTMSDTKFYIDGEQAKNDTLTAGEHSFEIRNGNISKKWKVDFATAANVKVVASAKSVNSTATLQSTLASAAQNNVSDVIEVSEDVTLTKAITIAAEDTLVIPYGVTVTATNVTNNGTIRGTENYGSNTPSTAGTLTVNGVLASTALNGSQIDLPGSSLELGDGARVSGKMKISGHIVVQGALTFTGAENEKVELSDGLVFEIKNPTKTIIYNTPIVIPEGDEVVIVSGGIESTVTGTDNTEENGAKITKDGDVYQIVSNASGETNDEKLDTDIVTDEEEDDAINTPAKFLAAVQNGGTVTLAGDIIFAENYAKDIIIKKNTVINMGSYTMNLQKAGLWVSQDGESSVDVVLSGSGATITGAAASAELGITSAFGTNAPSLTIEGVESELNVKTEWLPELAQGAAPVVNLPAEFDTEKVKASIFTYVDLTEENNHVWTPEEGATSVWSEVVPAQVTIGDEVLDHDRWNPEEPVNNTDNGGFGNTSYRWDFTIDNDD